MTTTTLSFTLDNTLRIALDDSSDTKGRIDVFYGGEWGAVCDDNFRMNEAKTACVQLGYDTANGFTHYIASGPSKYLLDEVQCNPSHARIQDCDHNPWGDHDCSSPSNQKVSVSCVGGCKYSIGRSYLKNIYQKSQC